MTDEQTANLIKEAMINAGLDEEAAERVAQSSRTYGDAIRRFESMESELTDLANAYRKVKSTLQIIAALLLTNWAGDIYEWIQVIGP